MTQVFQDPTLPTALAMREQFPTPQAIATPTLSALAELRIKHRYPSNTQLRWLEQLAAQRSGTQDLVRQRGLLREQAQLMRELRLLQEPIQQLDTEISQLVEHSREGQILPSIPGIGIMQAAAILAAIGTIWNCERASDLKSYFGWAPVSAISGTTLDRVQLTHGGTRTMKQLLFLCVAHAMQLDGEGAKLYARLVPKQCMYDERRRAYRGKLKVIGRIAGQMIEMISALVKQDAEILSQIPPGETPPEPILYDPDIHKRHRTGAYRPSKNTPRLRKVIRLPEHPR
jgi:transposase